MIGIQNRADGSRVGRWMVRGVLGAAILAGLCFAGGRWSAAIAQQSASAPALAPLDPQKVEDQDDMTWDDYRPIPGVNWADPKIVAKERTIHVALVCADFDDQPFVMTLPKNSDLFGNPVIDPVTRDAIAKFYGDFWNKPQQINHGHTVTEYWLELSHGKIGVQFDAYGPYHMPKKMIEYPGTVNGARRGSFAPESSSAPSPADSLAPFAPEDFDPQQGAPGGGAQAGGGGRGGRRGAAGTSATLGGGRGGRGGRGGASLESDLDAMWRPDSNGKEYQLVLRIYAGYDETCVWQEFGEMKFQTKEDITPEFGNPDPTQPRWSSTRYTDWTSWKAGSYLWSNSAIINGESSGSIRHEISHAAFLIGDNNNNPYVQPYRRVGSGPWDIMDRGSFNGPGGPHKRYGIPVLQGGAMPAGVMLSQQMKFGFITPKNVLRLSRENLAKSGLVVAKILPREVDPGSDKLDGLVISLDNTESVTGTVDRTPIEDQNADPMYGGNQYTYYTMEDVQRIGYDSFTPDNGVLIAKNTGSVGDRETMPVNSARRGGGAGGRGGRGGAGRRGAGRGGAGTPGGAAAAGAIQGGPYVPPDEEASAPQAPAQGRAGAAAGASAGGRRGGGARGGRGAGGYAPGAAGGGPGSVGAYFNWVIDANPQDMNKVDFTRPHGEKVMRTIADYRQLNDALFHAGLNSGSQFEYEDMPNRLHFYVIDLQQDEHGIRSYTVAVRSLDGSGPQQRGVALSGPDQQTVTAGGTYIPANFTLKNTGAAAATDPLLHLQDTNPWLTSDVYRLAVSVEGAGWAAQLKNALAAVKFGESQQVPVYVAHGAGSAATAKVTLKATSESDPTKTVTVTMTVKN